MKAARGLSIIGLIAVFVVCWSALTSTIKANSGPSEVSVANGSGYGSTGIYARTFGTVITNQGTKITYASDPVNGDSFTIDATGLYAISYTDGDPSYDDVGVSRNLPSTTQFANAWGTAQELCAFEVANTAEACSIVILLNKGDVIRAASEFSGNTHPNDQPIARLTITALP